jgi:hypothetical protein
MVSIDLTTWKLFSPGTDVHEELTYNLRQADGKYEKKITRFNK